MREKELFHVHTYHCKHAGDERDELYVKWAIELGACRITFTDHALFPGNPFGNRMGIEELPEYIDTLSDLKEHYKSDIDIRIGLVCCLLFMSKISDLFVDSVEIEAVVTKTYRSSGRAGSGGAKMNIEWVDLNGDTQTQGTMQNGYGLEVGDIYTILVDAKTHSRMVTSPTGSVCMFLGGLLGCIFDLLAMKVLYGCAKYVDV